MKNYKQLWIVIPFITTIFGIGILNLLYKESESGPPEVWSDTNTNTVLSTFYFKKIKLGKGSSKPVVISEFGGYSHRVEGHLFGAENYGYSIFEEREEFENAGLNETVWQYFIAVPDMKSVGVKDDRRYEGWPAIIRAVNTTDAMTATIEEIPYAVLHKITDRITHEVEGINRVLFDLTPKPTGTIEWE